MEGEDAIVYYNSSQSAGSKVLRLICRLINVKSRLENSRFTDSMQKANVPEPPARLLKGIDLGMQRVNGRKVFTLSAQNTNPKKHILFFHGGAYVIGDGRDEDIGFTAKTLLKHGFRFFGIRESG